ncbi:MAG TPA: 50S ribosomal protein L9 [Bacteroidales bacterium]|jgi:large subunit ribosomal protein L9|nr:50S ribosomal protein L9 [Bacteroidales bacterium]MDI9573438.1 50S ribosomal protein L9 [Bacteroidota bacterium]OQC61869.1 MAG: 50S ribosomal protein L9 [Bacteroidetes bacterium ADurb.Bin012]MBP9511241.1 50S ribosomal protein L9 [Bacteroidales bacterium]MBP9587662.1 50S ribosomal protein L9 [Bacteroidales bacterium]
MEVILIQDVPKLGYTDEIVNVKNGYALNYLIPKGYAIMANPSNRKVLAENLKQKAFKQEKVQNEALELAKKLDGLLIRVGAKASSSGKIYGSVNALQIAEVLKNQHHIEVDRKRILIDGDSIKELGTYTATINLHKDVKATIQFEVFAE